MYSKTVLIGNLGRDPEIKFFDNGGSVCRLNVATSEKWKDKDGTKQERTTWHAVQVHGKAGENAAEYLRKGSKVLVEGTIRVRDYTDKNGVERKAFEIIAREVKFLDSKSDGGGSSRHSDNGSFPPDGEDNGPGDDDIPF